MTEVRNETNYPIATQIDRGLFEIYNSPIYQRLYKANKFNYNIRKCDQNSTIQNIDPVNMPELDFTFTPADLYMDMTQTSLNTVLDIPVPTSFADGDYIVQQNGNIYRAPRDTWTNPDTWTDRMIMPFYSTAIISKVKLYKDNKNGDSLQWEQDYINTYAENAKLGSQEQVNICQTNCQVNNDTRILLYVPSG